MADRIFVSSTFVDLKNHRAAVREVIQKLGARDVSMEVLGARDERPLSECVRLVKEESDLFVGIYAHRYGFVPEGGTISITEAEYIAATEAHIPRLIFVVDEDASWPPKLIDYDVPRKQLERFKAHLRANHICESFSDPKDLAAKVAASVGREMNRRKLDKSFRLRLDADPTTQAKAANKPEDKDPITLFLSRLLEDISYWLDQTVFPFVVLGGAPVKGTFIPKQAFGATSALPSAFFKGVFPRPVQHSTRFDNLENAFRYFRGRLLLLGPPGSGKTTALLAFARDATKKRLSDDAAPVPLVARMSTWDGTSGTTLAVWLASQIPLLPVSNIQDLLASGRALLLLDGLDEVRWRKKDENEPQGPDPRQTLLELIPQGVQALITCREEDFEEIASAGAQFPVNGAVVLDALSERQRSELLNRRPELLALTTRESVVDRLTRNPLMLALLLSAYDGSGDEPQTFAQLDDETIRESVIGRFLQQRLEHEQGKYGGSLEFSLSDLYRLWGPVAMGDAGGGGNVNNFSVDAVKFHLSLSQNRATQFLSLSHTLGIIYSPGPAKISFTHLLFRDHFAFRYAKEALFSELPELRDAAAWAMWQIPDKRAVPLLVKALRDPYKYARGSAAGALGMIKDASAVDALAELLQDTMPVHSIYGNSIAEVAAWALQQIGTQQAHAYIRRWQDQQKIDS